MSVRLPSGRPGKARRVYRPSRVVPVVLAVAAAIALLVFLGLNRVSSGPSLERPTPSKGLELRPAPTTTGG